MRRRQGVGWRQWGPYLSERQWGTVREDYSDNGDAWNYFTHDQARSRAYRWGEDGLAGHLRRRSGCCASRLALWNGQDPILKERLFGLTNPEGNHGEDVKEYYFYVDNTPDPLVDALALQVPAGRVPLRRPGARPTGRAGSDDLEYELLDTGVFDDDRYFDVAGRLRQGRARRTCWSASRCANRGPEAAPIHLLPTLWFRNTWSWGERSAEAARCARSHGDRPVRRTRTHDASATTGCTCRGDAELLFCDNETNAAAAVGPAERRRRT